MKSDDHMGGGSIADSQIRNCFSLCHRALEKARAEHLILRDPTNECKLSPVRYEEMKILSRESMQKLLIQAKEENYYELFLLELATGLRLGEIAALQWNDLNLTTGELRINKQAGTSGPDVVICEPKTKAAVRTLILPPSVLKVMREYRARVDSRWMFPSPKKEDSPMRPSSIHLRLHRILDHAGCDRVRFHDLRHTFATLSLEHGMDVKTLSTIIGHVSSATTLNTYTHITDEMRRKAALNIDQGIAKAEAVPMPEQTDEPSKQDFVPVEPPRRRPGTGCVSQLREHLWEGRYSPVWPDGKKHSRNVYAKTREECEEKLKVLILEMKAEIAALRSGASTEYPDGVSPKKKAIATYLREHPGVSSKSLIARELQMARSTVQRYYDEIRMEFQMQE